jgi:hypothetical protein
MSQARGDVEMPHPEITLEGLTSAEAAARLKE